MKKSFLTPLFVLFFSVFNFSQTGEVSISVTVKNQLGEVVPDAEVSLFEENSQIATAKTNKQGVARFSRIETGVYRLKITAKDFKEYTEEAIELKRGAVNALEATLEVSAIESVVSVGGDDAVDTENFGTTRIISEAQIDKLPDDERELEKALRALAGETATGEQPTITVDGQPGGKIPPKSAIQQVRINQNVFSAQYEGTSGGGIEIFTRSNVDKFSGGGYFTFADSRLNAADAFIGRRLPSQLRNYNVNLSGPIRKNMSFFTSINHNQSDSSVAINAKTLDANLNPIDVRETFAAPSRNWSVFSTLTYDPNKKNKIAVNAYSSINRTSGQNVGGFSLASRENKSDSQFYNFSMSESYFPNPNTVIQTRFSLNYSDSKSFGGDNSPAINVLEAFFGGGAQNDSQRKNLNLSFGNDTSWQKGKYGLNVGWQIRRNFISQNSTANFGGTYFFSGRTAPVLDANNNPILDGNGNFLTTQITSLESYRRTFLFQKLGFTSEQIRNLGGGASQFTISGGDPQLSVNQTDVAFYFQNSYKLSETVAASFGLRYENQTNVSDNLNFSPRVGLIWSPKAKDKQKPLFVLPKISIGAGVFYRRFDVNNFVSIAQAAGERFEYFVTDPFVLNAFPNTISLDQLQNFAAPRSQRLIAGDLQTPLSKIFNVTVTKKMPLEFSLTFSTTYSKTLRQAQTQNVNAPLAGTYNPLLQNSGVRPFGNVGNIYETFSGGKSDSLRYSVSLNLPQKIGWGNINYSFLKAKNDIVAGSGSPFDAYDFSQEYAFAQNDGVHRLSGYFYTDKLPYKISLDANFDISGGSRFNIITGRDTNGDGYFLERPAFAADLTKAGLIETPYGILDPNPAPTDKLIPRNLGRGARNFAFDVGIGRSFDFGADKANKKPAKRSLYLNMRINNVFNVVSRGLPVGNISSPNFLRTLSNSQGDSFYIINGIRSGSGGRAFAFGAGFRFN